MPNVGRWAPPARSPAIGSVSCGEQSCGSEWKRVSQTRRQQWPVLTPEHPVADSHEQIFLAAPQEHTTGEGSSSTSPPRARQYWLDSDDAPCCPDGKSVKLIGLGKSRQSVLSNDYVHENHECATREWTIYASEATFDYGDIYFGFTESTYFSKAGRTMLFDVRGNMRYGFHPLQLVYCERRLDVQRMGGTSFTGDFCGLKNDKHVITLDLYAQAMTIRNLRTSSTLELTLPAWPLVSCARLCVSMRTAGDCVVIETVC